MNQAYWIEWKRTRPTREAQYSILESLTADQKADLLKHDYVWVQRVGVIWKDETGRLRRSRFTHCTDFRTQRGEIYIDSEGTARAR